MDPRSAKKSTCQLSQLALVAILGLTAVGLAAREGSDQVGAVGQVDGLPSRWIDLPESPFHIVISSGRAALINRSGRTFQSASVGCVTGQRVVEVIGSLVTVGNANGWRSGEPVSVLGATLDIERNLPNPEYRKLYPNLKYCADGLRVAVVHARADDGYEWTAAGTPWPPGRTTG